jgi:hypothetical protein
MAPDKPAKLAAILALLSSDKPGEAQTPTGSFDIFRDWPTRWRAAVYVCRRRGSRRSSGSSSAT